MSKYSLIVFDVDGVLSTGRFFYTKEGKYMKEFGPDDHDALKITAQFINIEFITADKKGFSISKKRIQDEMGFQLSLVSTDERLTWFQNKKKLSEVIYMADSFKDIPILKKVGFAMCPSNSDDYCKSVCSYISKNSGGNRAVSEACFYVLKNLLNIEIKNII
tara:strand:- start:9221 stop:9706 length:486 start_codon:yes stop_codon:yes gene_type:complete